MVGPQIKLHGIFKHGSCIYKHIDIYISVMLALPHHAAIVIRQRGATTLSSSINALYFRRIHLSSNSANPFRQPPRRLSTAFAVAVSCAAVGGLFMSHTALSDSGNPAPAVVASVPPSATSFTASGDVPSSASHLNLSFTAGLSPYLIFFVCAVYLILCFQLARPQMTQLKIDSSLQSAAQAMCASLDPPQFIADDRA
jgi:hypothetical protein